MSANIARKRHMRTTKRKQVVAQKRRLEVIESTVGARARRASSAPIRCCLLHGALEAGAVEGGIASVVLARGRTFGAATTAVFLVDTYCLGIKDVLFRDLDADELADLCEAMSETELLQAVPPELARKLLRDAAKWAAQIGFKPHRDFVAIEQIFGDIDADASDAEFVFGLEGKPFYVPGPTETPAQVRRRFAQLVAYLGEKGALEYAQRAIEMTADIDEDALTIIPPQGRAR